jgi:long-chain acyl-CoA synthetase
MERRGHFPLPSRIAFAVQEGLVAGAAGRPQPVTLAELVAADARREPDRVAVILDDRSYSYAQVEAMIERAADALAAQGVRPGDRVALMLPNDLSFIAAFYAAARVGAIVVPLNPAYRSELTHLLNDSEPAFAVVDAALWEHTAASFQQARACTVALAGPGASRWTGGIVFDWEALQARGGPRGTHVPKPSDIAVICYTGGTTGHPKGAMHSHASLLGNCRQAGSMLRRRFGPEDRALVSVPLFHMYGLQSGLNQMFRVGGSFVLMRRFDATGVLRNVEHYRCTYLLAAPPMFVRWTEATDLRTFDLSSLRVVTSGTAPLSANILHEFEAATGVPVSESYGLTEAGPTTHSNSNGPRNKLGSVGPPIPDVESRLVDAAGVDVAPGEPGQIVVRSPALMIGYWRDAAATAAAIRDGWLYTGDIAVEDGDGYYTIVDREKDMISAGGFKVWPREVEDALAAHPAVLEVSVVGVPDRYSGEKPMAYVVLRAGFAVQPVELADFARATLASFKVPARIELLDALPRSAVGKILRRELRERAKASVGETAAR